MSEHKPKAYKLDHSQAAREQVRAIAAYARTITKSGVLGRILREALQRLQADPNGWGDPEYRSKHVDALYCHATIRPLTFRYVIYEQVRGVVLLNVRMYADFD